jgi:hypothetical protein
MDGSFVSQREVSFMQKMRYMEWDSVGSSSKGLEARDSSREAEARDLINFSGNIKRATNGTGKYLKTGNIQVNFQSPDATV